jgi:hypothetical protein
VGVAIYRYNDTAKTLDPFDLSNQRVIFVSPGDPPPPPPPPPPGSKLLLVTESTTLSVGHTALRDMLVTAGWEVVVRSWYEAVNYDDIAVVVVSRGNPEGDAGRYLHPPVGIVGVDTWRPLGMGTQLGFLNNITDVEVVDTVSPLAAGVTGTFPAYLAGAYITWAPDSYPAMQVVVTRPSQPTQRVVFGYEAGSQMATRFATTRHVGMGYHENGLANGLTQNAKDQVLAAVNWAAASTYVAPPPTPDPGENLALLVTSNELSMWQSRSVNGPFRVAGDFSANSPGHWSEMSSAMSLNFASARWSGPTLLNDSSDPNNHPAGAVRRGQLTENMPPGAVRGMAHDMMSAAYAAMVTDNTAVAQAITNEIAYQATRPRLDFSNRTLWPTGYYNDINPLFMMAVWIKDYVLAYAVTKAMGYPSATVEKWFLDLSWLNEWYVHNNLSGQMPNRKSDSYTSRGSALTSETFEAHRLANGTLVGMPRISYFYNNRRNNQAGLFGLVGALLDNSTYVGEFKRYMREFVMFGTALGDYGGYGDHNRGTNTFPQLGFSYALHGMESCLPAMDALARKGDTSLYEFSSTDGATTPKWATNYLKSMETVLDGHLKWIAQTWPAQYTDSSLPPSSGVAGNAFYRVHSRNTDNNREMVNDANFLYAANYYNRQDWVDIIMRKGTPFGFTSTVQGVGSISGWRTDWRNRFLRSLDANPYGGS